MWKFNPFTGTLDQVGTGGGGSGMAIGDPVSGGTGKRVLFVDASGDLAQDSEFQFETSVNRLNVGAASSSSDGIIVVGGSGTGVGQVTGGGGELHIVGGDLYIESNNTHFMAFKTGTVERLRITNTGEWLLAGDEGDSGQVITSQGTGTPPIWTTVPSNYYADTTPLNSITAPTGDVSLNSHKLTNVTDPTSAQDAATKAYVDAIAQGLSVKASVKLATAAALPTNTYLAGVITITTPGVLTVDGTAVALNDRILVKDEVSQLKNGVYVVTTAGAVGVAAVLTRSSDMDAANEFPGAFVFVESGTANTAAGFVCTNSTPPTLGTTAITFTQFSGAGEITAGTGLSKTGNTLSIDTAITVDKTTAQTLTNKTLTSPAITSPTGIVKGDVGLGSVDNTSDATKNAATVTLTNKRITRRVVSVTQSATPTSNTDNADVFSMTALAQAVTNMSTNQTGTPADGDMLIWRITDSGTARALSWGTLYESSTVSLPTTTVISTLLMVGFMWNTATSKWRCIAVA